MCIDLMWYVCFSHKNVYCGLKLLIFIQDFVIWNLHLDKMWLMLCGRSICATSWQVDMWELDLRSLVKSCAATYARMNLVWWFLFSISTIFRRCGSFLNILLRHLYVAFFYCEVDGSSLCLQCDMIVHVGGKRTHERYLLLRQRVEVCGYNYVAFKYCYE